MTNKVLIALFYFSLSLGAVAGDMEDDPIIGKVMVSQFETRITGGPDPAVLEAQAWIGKDLQKLWFKADAERVGGNTDEAQIQALYSRAIAPYWDFQTGWRHDSQPGPDRDWAVIGLQGLAPYFFEVDAAAFLGKNGRTAVRLEAEYEVLFSQRLILTPEIEVNVHGKNDAVTGVGSGLSDLELGLRLRYEIRREFAPYIGVNWTKKYGQTADFARLDGEDTSDTQFLLGIRAWF